MGFVENRIISYVCDGCGETLSGTINAAEKQVPMYFSIKNADISLQLYDKRTKQKDFAYLTGHNDKLLCFCDGLCFELWFENKKHAALNGDRYEKFTIYQDENNNVKLIRNNAAKVI